MLDMQLAKALSPHDGLWQTKIVRLSIAEEVADPYRVLEIPALPCMPRVFRVISTGLSEA